MRRLLLILVAATLTFTALPVGASAPPEDYPFMLPAPGRAPSYALIQRVGHELGALRIPAIGVDATVREGVSLQVLDRGPGHWVGTSLPGGTGNVVIGGHRTTFGAPFLDVDLLEFGDLIYLTDTRGFEVMYRVRDVFIVQPEDVWITFDVGRPVLTLFACHPKGSLEQRIVVRADMVGGRRVA